MSESIVEGSMSHAGVGEAVAAPAIGAVTILAQVSHPTSVQADPRVQEDFTVSKVMEDLTGQVSEFETKYAGLSLTECKPAIDHFESIIQYVDSMSEDAKERYRNELAKDQLLSITSLTRVLQLGQAIESYCKDLEPGQSLAVASIVDRLQNGPVDADEKAEIIDSLASHSSLVALIIEHEQAAKIVEENSRYYSNLSATISSLRNLRTSVRLLIAQAYSRMGFIVLAKAIKQEAGLLDITGPWNSDGEGRRKLGFVSEGKVAGIGRTANGSKSKTSKFGRGQKV